MRRPELIQNAHYQKQKNKNLRFFFRIKIFRASVMMQAPHAVHGLRALPANQPGSSRFHPTSFQSLNLDHPGFILIHPSLSTRIIPVSSRSHPKGFESKFWKSSYRIIPVLGWKFQDWDDHPNHPGRCTTLWNPGLQTPLAGLGSLDQV